MREGLIPISWLELDQPGKLGPALKPSTPDSQPNMSTNLRRRSKSQEDRHTHRIGAVNRLQRLDFQYQSLSPNTKRGSLVDSLTRRE